MSKLNSLVLLSIILGLLGINSPAISQNHTYAIGTLKKSREILPHFQVLGSTPDLRRLTIPPLVSIQTDGKVTCMLCSDPPDVEMIKLDKTGSSELAVSFTLKKDLEWGDGHELTPADIKFTLEFMSKVKYPPGQRPILPIRLIQIDAVNKNKIRLILRHRRADAKALFAISLLPKHKEKDLNKIVDSTLRPEEIASILTNKAYYYGPYTIKSATSDTLFFEPNKKNQWEDLPKAPIILRLFDNLQSLASALHDGTIDQVLPDELSPDDFWEVKKRTPLLAEKYVMDLGHNTTLDAIIFNQRSPILSDPMVRNAIFHAIDRRKINQIAYEGLATPMEALLHPAVTARLGQVSPKTFDPTVSAQMLDNAGWIMKNDGFRYRDTDQRLSLTLSCTDEHLRAPWYPLVRDDLQKIGVELNLERIDKGEFNRQTLKHRRFKELACIQWNLPPLSTPIQLFHSLAIPTQENQFNGLNFGGWEQSAVDRLLETMVREHDGAHFLRHWARLEKLFLNDIPGVPIVYQSKIGLRRKTQTTAEQEEIQKSLATFSSSRAVKM